MTLDIYFIFSIKVIEKAADIIKEGATFFGEYPGFQREPNIRGESLRVFDIASRAIGEQYTRLRESAARIARINGPLKEGESPPDIAKETVNNMQADVAVKANLKVIKAEDDRLKHLLDTFI